MVRRKAQPAWILDCRGMVSVSVRADRRDLLRSWKFTNALGKVSFSGRDRRDSGRHLLYCRQRLGIWVVSALVPCDIQLVANALSLRHRTVPRLHEGRARAWSG